jgi:hypothetical protein
LKGERREIGGETEIERERERERERNALTHAAVITDIASESYKKYFKI